MNLGAVVYVDCNLYYDNFGAGMSPNVLIEALQKKHVLCVNM